MVMIFRDTKVALASFLAKFEKHESLKFENCEISDANILNSICVGVEFQSCTFVDSLICPNITFEKNIFFETCIFNEIVNFDDCKFTQGVTFKSCKFEGSVYLRRCEFIYDCFVNQCVFKKSLNFRDSSFYGYADFSSSQFSCRIKVMGCTFKDEIRLSDCDIQYFKDVDTHNIDFTGSILNDATFWKSSTISNCSFKNCTLISVSFSGKKFVNCDFTGAVLKAVAFNGAIFDNETVKNTKFIFTDFCIDKSDKITPLQASRVPINGEFGYLDNEIFTIENCVEPSLLWSRSFNIPKSLKSALLGYFQFFADYIEVTQDIKVNFQSSHEGDRIKTEFSGDSKIDSNIVVSSLNKYIQSLLIDSGDRDIDFSNGNTNEIEQELFTIRYESAISSLKTQLSYSQLILKKEEEKNAQLLDVISSMIRNPQKFLLGDNKNDAASVYNITSIQEMHNSQLQQSSPNSKQSSEFNFSEVELLEVLRDIKSSFSELNLSIEKRMNLQRVVADVESSLSHKTSSNSMIEGIRSIRNILEGTAGSLVASGILNRIGLLLG